MSDTNAPDPTESAESKGANDEEAPDGVVDRMRGSGVGVEDPNIVGDAGPTDVAPGQDPDGGALIQEGDDPGEV